MTSLEKRSPRMRRLWLALILASWAGIAFAGEPPAAVVNAESQEKVAQLLQIVIQHYWSGGDGRSAPRIAGVGDYTNVETAFRAAVKLMPDRLDLRFGVASVLISQALQTNGLPLEMKVRDALQVYREIQALDPKGFDAPILDAAYSRAIGDTNASAATMSGLMGVHPQRTTEYLQKFQLADCILQTIPSEHPRKTMPNDERHAIVILGAGLETNGTMKPKLVSRLRQGLKLARIYTNAPIILTGGNQKSGVTEAYVMSAWLKRRGVARKRLFLEDQAKDTVGNAVFCAAILHRLAITHVTLVTSTNHVRRALADLQEACRQRGLILEYDHLAAKTKGDVDLDPVQERVGVYRDVLRTSGLWAFPGIQQ